MALQHSLSSSTHATVPLQSMKGRLHANTLQTFFHPPPLPSLLFLLQILYPSIHASVSRVKRVREKYEVELRDLEHSERAAVEKQQQLRKVQVETEGELIGLQGLLRQRDQEMEAIVQVGLVD